MRIVNNAPILLALLSSSALTTEAINYAYDTHGRLVAVSHSGGPNDGVQTSISHDAVDNRTNYTVTGAVSTFSIADASVTEGENLSFIVTRSGPGTGSITVNFATSDGTATSGSDYGAASGTLTFAPNETSKTVTISTVDDAAVEGNENLTVTLANPSAGAVLGRAIATGTIVDNDSYPLTLAISDAPTVAEGGTLVYTVIKTGATSATVSVNYNTVDGSGLAGADYVASSGTLTFGPSDATKTISVGTVDDSTPEPAKTVLVNLSGATNGAVITSSQATGIVNDNDTTPISFAIAGASAVTEGGVLVFTVTRSGTTYATTSVNYATADGSANAGSDYNATGGTLTFGPSEMSKTISITTIDDGLNEPTESMLVNLSAPNGGTISVGQGAGTIIDNDLPPIAASNPHYVLLSAQVLTIPLSALAVLNGRSARISSFTPAGNGDTAMVAGDGGSVKYTAAIVARGKACEPGPTINYSVAYSIEDASNGSSTPGSVSFAVTGLDGNPPKNGCP